MNENNKRTKWSDKCDAVFLDLWEEHQPSLRGQRKNSHIYKEMAEALQKAGFCHTAQEVRCKIYNLSKKYREVKSECGSGSAPPTWALYERINKIIGRHASNNINDTEQIIDSILNMSSSEEPLLPASLSLPSDHSVAQLSHSTAPSTKKKDKVLDELTSLIKETAENDKAFSQKLIENEEARLEELRKFRESNEKMSDAFIKFLNK